MSTDFIKDHPIPGESLTQNEGTKLPYENPPEEVDLQVAAKRVWDRLSSRESLPQLYRMLRQDTPVSDIARTIAYSGFAEGKWSFDLNLLLIEPIMFQIMHLAQQGGVSYIFSPEMNNVNEAIKERNDPPIKQELQAENPVPGLMAEDDEEMMDE